MNANALPIQRHQQTKEGKPVFNKTIRSSLIPCGSNSLLQLLLLRNDNEDVVWDVSLLVRLL